MMRRTQREEKMKKTRKRLVVGESLLDISYIRKKKKREFNPQKLPLVEPEKQDEDCCNF